VTTASRFERLLRGVGNRLLALNHFFDVVRVWSICQVFFLATCSAHVTLQGMVRDLAPLLLFVAAFAAAAKRCFVRAATLVSGLFSASSSVRFLALPQPFALTELICVVVPRVGTIRRTLRELADQLQPRAPPVAA
jgi:hypothetical protein